MNDTKLTIKGIIKYLSTILSWALFVMLLLCALGLFIYYVSGKINIKNNSNYKPLVSIYTIVSPSMVPTIDVYDIIINRRVENPEEIKVGDIITFISTSSISEGMTVTHRVTEVELINGEYQFVTKGDNNVSEDGRPAEYKNVIGKAVVRLPQLGRVQFFVASKFGWITVVIIPAFYIIIKDIYKIIQIKRIRKTAEFANQKVISEKKEKEIDGEEDE